MNSTTSLLSSSLNPLTETAVLPRRSMAAALAPLERMASGSSSLLANHGANFEAAGRKYDLPRYLVIGPKGGDDPIRLGLFAGLHGDAPEGVYALIQFLVMLEESPELARGYCLFVYPVCNPTGFEDHTRLSRSGRDLDRQFWQGSGSPETKLLESELVAHAFHGIVSLYTDRNSLGFYGFAHGATLTRHLIEPALQAAEEFLPRNGEAKIEGLRARNGIIRHGHPGALSGAPRVRPRPFEIALATPEQPPTYLKETAFVAALRTILARYRELISYAPNL